MVPWKEFSWTNSGSIFPCHGEMPTHRATESTTLPEILPATKGRTWNIWGSKKSSAAKTRRSKFMNSIWGPTKAGERADESPPRSPFSPRRSNWVNDVVVWTSPGSSVASDESSPRSPLSPFGSRRSNSLYNGVVTTDPGSSVSTRTDESSPKSAFGHSSRLISRIGDREFSQLYKLGKEVMPSGHQGMMILFAKRRMDRSKVVVKIRQKTLCFATESDEQKWRATMEMLLNLPPRDTICRLLEVLEDSLYYYVVMERIKGTDLFDSMDFRSPWPIDDVRLVLRQLLDSVAYLHSEGYIHKDLNLENVMIDSPPSSRKSFMSSGSSPSPGQTSFARTVKLMHFDNVEEWTPMSPKAKQILGTDHYIAPEVYSGNYSQASDMFAVGVIAHKLIVGKFPFPRDFFDDKPGENYVGSPKMKQIKQRLTTYNIDFDVEVFKKEPDAFDFCKRLLDSNVNERLEAVQALQHPFIVKLSKRKPLSMMPRMIVPKAAES
eukprot:gnl/TRDRNA2_/TRDRNA2_175751_c3_seq14.p1 gnl/TRDRNA2_/TRDRNA2_175751_c3~~gnl/TRDRNA2_/TRDRNA2_175751_c3_seq14.p1  ORF type:complete len:492 (-),score=76.67 gnl/TRDRNA2_/TRDRNA2_175751_c3_seq14:154-1629(-)